VSVPFRPVRLVDKLGRAFELRPATADDRAALFEMYRAFEPKRCAQGLPPAGDEALRKWLDTILAQGDHVVAMVEGAVLGHGMLLPFEPRSAELANFLHQSVRDRGIGTALNRALIEIGRHRGIARVWLSVEPSNRMAIQSYRNVGFRIRPASAWAPEVEMEVHLGSTPGDADGAAFL
jgi:ribosomal protein S18 acetylase RimI-like enzyme